ncbi:MAG: isochorismatase family protein [Bacteroidota bacterium]
MNQTATDRPALVIIDMQKGSFTAETPRFDTVGTVRRINQLAQHFRTQKWPVIFIQHDGSRENAFGPHTEEWELLDDLDIQDTDLIIPKIANDMFYQTILAETLAELGVGELYLTGCATDFCVASAVQSALHKDFQLTIVSDGHTTADRPGLSAKQVIDHHNWVWQNMIPTKGRIRVGETLELL